MDDRKPSELTRLFEAAREHRARGEVAAALALFEAAAKIDSRNPGIKVEIARDLRALDRLDEADAVLAAVLAADAANPGGLVERGHLLRRRRDREAALAAFEAAAAANPENLAIPVEVARDRRALGRLDDAAESLQAILERDGSYLGAFIERGILERQRGDHVAALAAFEAAGAIEPGHAGVALERVSELRALGRAGDAETLLLNLHRSAPDNPTVSLALGHFLVEESRLGEAETLLAGARERHPSDPRIVRTLAQLARRRGDRVAALDHLRIASRLSPESVDVRLELAAELREEGGLDEALRIVETALGDRPDSARGLIQLGLVHRARQERGAAAEAFRRALLLDPSATQALVELAREAWAVGHPDQAAALLERALSAEPGHLAALLLAAEHALLAEDAATGLRLAERAIDVAPGQLGPYLLGARAAAALVDRGVAERLLDQAGNRFGEVAEVLAMRVHVRRHLHDHAGARAVTEGRTTAGHFGLWMESTAAAITLGDFAAVERAFDSVSPASPRERAAVRFVRGQMAEAERRYGEAAKAYGDALALDGWNGGWHSELARVLLLRLDTVAAREHLRQSLSVNASANLLRGQSLKPSQHHIGQLLDEFELDGPVLALLREISGSAPGKRVERLKEVVRAQPGSTAAAIMLLLQLRESGSLTPGERRRLPLFRRAAAIPRRVVQYWDAEVPPPEVRELVATWRGGDDAIAHQLFNDSTADAFLRANAPPAVAGAFRRARHPAERSDIFRLAYLAVNGGLYADADDRRKAPFDELLPRAASFVAYQEDYGTIANNVIAAIPRHPVILRALDLAAAAVNRGDGDIVWLATGPGLLTRAFAQLASEPGHGRWLARTAVFELWQMHRLVDIHCPARYKTTDRHWSRAAYRAAGANRSAAGASPATAEPSHADAATA